MRCSAGNIASSSPRELNLIAVDISALCLGVDALNNVSVGELPFACTFRLVESEIALKEGAVGVAPLTFDELTILEGSNILLACLEEDVSTLSVLLSAGPVSGVNI